MLGIQAPAQGLKESRKQILSDIRTHRDSAVISYAFDASSDTLLANVEDVMTSLPYPYTVISSTPDELILRVLYSKFALKRNVTGRREGATRYSERWYHLFLTIYAEQDEKGVKLEILDKTRRAQMGSRRTQFPNSPTYEDVWSELALRWELYRRYNNGQSPPLPQQLLSRIDAFNAIQQSDKRKLKAGKDY